MKYPKRNQYKYAKSRYRVRNWAEYEAGLRCRGDLTVWLSKDAIDSWREPPSGKPGGQRTYADIAIEAALTIRMVFHLPLRQTEGFLRSLAQQVELDLPIPITRPCPGGTRSSERFHFVQPGRINRSISSSIARV